MTREQIAKLMESETGEHMGDLVGWNIQCPTQRETIDKVATDAGILDALALPVLGPSNAYRRAVKASVKSGKRGRRKLGDNSGYQVVLISEDSERIVHAICQTGVVRAARANGTISTRSGEYSLQRGVRLDEEFRVSFDKRRRERGGSLESLVSYSHPTHAVAQKIATEYRAAAIEFSSNDLRAAFQAAFTKWDGCRVIPQGGMWWIPACNSDKVAAWADMLRELGHLPVVLPVYNDDETVASLQHAARQNLEGRLQEIIEGLERFQNPRSTKIQTLEARVRDYDDLKTRAATYEKLLGYKLTQLKKSTSTARKALVDTIAGRKAKEPTGGQG